MTKRDMQLVVFGLNNEFYGVDTQIVTEISRMEEITPIPRAQAFIEGILNLRGQIIPVVCLRKRLGMKSRLESKETRIIIVELNEVKVGLIVDYVSEVITLTETTTTPGLDATAEKYVAGVCHYGNNFAIIIDLFKLFAEQLDVAAAR